MWPLNYSRLAAITALVALAAPSGPGPGRCESAEPKAVVELFTSQGCSSCPPADKLLKTYVERADVIALSYPVDYWDYLGWKDTFASPRFSERQRAYAKTRGDGSVYTPQIVVNGRLHTVGSRQKLIDKTIVAANRLGRLQVPVKLRHDSGMMLIEVGRIPSEPASSATEWNATVWVATVKKISEVDVRRGENGGRKLTYYNTVRELTPVGIWTGEPATFRLDPKSVSWMGSNACAVLVQQGVGGPIIGAAWMESL
jgi:hypothetical protein